MNRKKYETLAKLVVWGVGLAIAGPFIWMSLEGLFALAALGLTAGVIWSVAPGVADWFANKRIALIKAVAEANPIETMNNLYLEKCDEFRVQQGAVTEFETQYRNVADMVEGLKRTDPAEAAEFSEELAQMKYGLESLRAEQKAAQGELNVAKETIAKMERLWKVANAMNKALAASSIAQSKKFNEIKQAVAFDTVRTNLNRAFSNLNTAVERRKNAEFFEKEKEAKALPPKQEVEVFDLTKGEKLKVNR
jgi:DNA repair exonuclease SbcCD ATPase subunit